MQFNTLLLVLYPGGYLTWTHKKRTFYCFVYYTNSVSVRSFLNNSVNLIVCMLHFWELRLIIYRSGLNYSCHWIQIYAAIDLEGKILNDLGSVFGDPQVKENLTLVLLSVVRSLLFLLICILCACTTNILPECITDLHVWKLFKMSFAWQLGYHL